MLKTIWTLIKGIDKELSQILAKLDEILFVQDAQSAQLSSLSLKLDRLYELLLKVQAELTPPSAVALAIQLDGMKPGDTMLTVADSGSVLATLEADDALGNAGAALDAAPVWSLSDASFGTVNAAADGLTAVVVLAGKLGTFKLHVEATAAGAPLSADSDDIQVVVGAAALLKVSVSSQ